MTLYEGKTPKTVRLDSKVAAGYLGLAPSTLAKMRIRGDGPVFIKVGPRRVVYDVRDLDAWLSENRRSSTSDTSECALASI